MCSSDLFGQKRETAVHALLPLLKGTVAAIEKGGLARGLAGPVSRGDAGTVRRQLEGIAGIGDRRTRQYTQQGGFSRPVAANQRQPLAGRDRQVDAVQDRLVAEVKADAAQGQEGWFGHVLSFGAGFMAEPVHIGKDNSRR